MPRVKIFTIGQKEPILDFYKNYEEVSQTINNLDDSLSNNTFVSYTDSNKTEVLVRTDNITHIHVSEE